MGKNLDVSFLDTYIALEVGGKKWTLKDFYFLICCVIPTACTYKALLVDVQLVFRKLCLLSFYWSMQPAFVCIIELKYPNSISIQCKYLNLIFTS